MRHFFAVVCLVSILWPFATAQQDDDDDDGDDVVGAEGPSVPLPQIASPVQAKTEPAAVVNMASNLNHFGQQQAAAPAPAPAQEAAAPAAAKAAPSTKDAQVAADAKNAHLAAESAKSAAEVANKVAVHSVHITQHAQSALKDAQNALHTARVNSEGLSKSQKHSLKTAEAKLKEATKVADYGAVKNAKYVKAEVENNKLQEMEKKMSNIKKEEKKKKEKIVKKTSYTIPKMEESKIIKDEDKKRAGGKQEEFIKKEGNEELDAMRKELEDLRNQLKKKEGDNAEDDAAMKELQDKIKDMEHSDKKEDHASKQSHDEMKAEIESLRDEIKSMQDKKDAPKPKIIKKEDKKRAGGKQESKKHDKDEDVEKYDVEMKPVRQDEEEEVQERAEATPVEKQGLDIDTAMPYGDLEPFGREDTAQELTEASIKESDGMVDQIEKAEVSEEKRSVFRALTRLRGAAITSFDGVARSQTGNIDEYNKINKWRSSHPLHHLADEESDVSKWAFPDNAD